MSAEGRGWVVPVVRVLLVDDHRLVVEALARVLQSDPEIEVAGTASSAPEALVLTKALAPSVVLMDIGLPGMDGVEATWTIRRLFPSLPVLVLTMFEQEAYVHEALRAGATGYLLKTAGTRELIDAVHAVASGQRVVDARIAPTVWQRGAGARAAARGPNPLSRREMEVVRRVAAGRSVREMAGDLRLSPHTIRNHLKSAYRKLGVHSQAEAAVHAVRRGLA